MVPRHSARVPRSASSSQLPDLGFKTRAIYDGREVEVSTGSRSWTLVLHEEIVVCQ